MNLPTLIQASELQVLMASGQPLVILDCGYDLGNSGAGERAHAAGHLPGAQYAHLERELSGTKTGSNGRHPLPERDELARRVGGWGIRPGVPVVCYDDQGLPYAARAWWLLHWIGHACTRVLDGGRAAWLAAGGSLETSVAEPVAAPPYPAAAPAMPTITSGQLQTRLQSLRLLDARAGERFRGEMEPLDPVAGHIPGSRNRFFRDNLGPDGRFKPAAVLRAEFEAHGVTSVEVVQQCGSGVTACHNLLAMAHAGLGISTLYPGSWSEWCSDARRPVALGDRT